MLGIGNDFVLKNLISDDEEAIEYREDEEVSKLDENGMLKMITSATLVKNIPPAIKSAPIVRKIYSSEFADIITDLENFTINKYKEASKNILKLAEGEQIEQDDSQDESDADKIAAEEEAKRQQEEEASRIAAEEEAKRLEEEEAARIAAEEEAKRLEEEEAARIAAEEEAKDWKRKKQPESQPKRKLESLLNKKLKD